MLYSSPPDPKREAAARSWAESITGPQTRRSLTPHLPALLRVNPLAHAYLTGGEERTGREWTAAFWSHSARYTTSEYAAIGAITNERNREHAARYWAAHESYPNHPPGGHAPGAPRSPQ